MKKRIALSAVVALFAGLLAAAPASAAIVTEPWAVAVPAGGTGPNSDTMTVSQIAGAGNYVAIAASDDVADTTGAAGYHYVTVSGSTFANVAGTTAVLSATAPDATNWAFNGASVQSSTLAYAPDNGDIDNDQLWIATPAAGTITVKFIERSVNGVTGIATDNTLQTLTITVLAAAANTAYVKTTVGAATEFGGAVATAAGDIYASSGVAGVPSNGASFVVTQYADAAGTIPTADTSTKAVTISVAGVGLITDAAFGVTTSPTTYLAYAAGTFDNGQMFKIWNDGRSGVATVTITVDGVAVATRKVTFYGAVASLSATVVKAYIADNGVATTDVVAVTAKDAAGILVPGAIITATTTDSDVTGSMVPQMPTSAGVYHLSATAQAGETGPYTFTFKSGTTVTTTAVVNVSNMLVKTATLTLDKATYAPGEKATLTLTLKDSNGLPVPDKTAALWLAAALTSSAGITQELFTGGAVTTKNGVATATFYMPLVSGPVLITGTTATATSIAPVALSASATVAQGADAAAQAAAIAALQTSVAALQTTVASLVASITAQIKAINSALRKIAAKMKVKL